MSSPEAPQLPAPDQQQAMVAEAHQPKTDEQIAEQIGRITQKLVERATNADLPQVRPQYDKGTELGRTGVATRLRFIEDPTYEGAVTNSVKHVVDVKDNGKVVLKQTHSKEGSYFNRKNKEYKPIVDENQTTVKANPRKQKVSGKELPSVVYPHTPNDRRELRFPLDEQALTSDQIVTTSAKTLGRIRGGIASHELKQRAVKQAKVT